MKTILQIAKEIGVLKQAVYKRYKGKLHTEISPYIHTKDGTTYIEEQGEEIIKRDFLKNDSISIGAHTVVDTEYVRDIPINTLIQMLQRELEVKNKQIEELTETVRVQAESIKATQQNQLAETIIDGQASIQELPETSKKRGFFSRIFSKGK